MHQTNNILGNVAQVDIVEDTGSYREKFVNDAFWCLQMKNKMEPWSLVYILQQVQNPLIFTQLTTKASTIAHKLIIFRQPVKIFQIIDTTLFSKKAL